MTQHCKICINLLNLAQSDFTILSHASSKYDLSIREGLLIHPQTPTEQANYTEFETIWLCITSWWLFGMCYTQCTVYAHLLCFLHCYNAYIFYGTSFSDKTDDE